MDLIYMSKSMLVKLLQYSKVSPKNNCRFPNCMQVSSIRVPHKTKDTQVQFLNHYYENITAAYVEKMKKHDPGEKLSEDSCIASQIT